MFRTHFIGQYMYIAKNKQAIYKRTQMVVNIQIKIALSVEKASILIKNLAESHMAFNLLDNIDIRKHTDRRTSPKTLTFTSH